MSRDHSNIMHQWCNLWEDEQWHKKGAVTTTKTIEPSKRWSSEGTLRGGAYGLIYKSYTTVVAAVAWSNKKRSHVFLIEAPGNGWSKTTTKQLYDLYRATPGNRHTIQINSRDGYGILHHVFSKHCTKSWDKAWDNHEIKAIATELKRRIAEFWDNPTARRKSRQDDRILFCDLAVTLVALAEYFGHTAIGTTKTYLQDLKAECDKLYAWTAENSKQSQRDTAARIAEQRSKNLVNWFKATTTRAKRDKYMFSSYQASARDNPDIGATIESIYGSNWKNHLSSIGIGLIDAMPFVTQTSVSQHYQFMNIIKGFQAVIWSKYARMEEKGGVKTITLDDAQKPAWLIAGIDVQPFNLQVYSEYSGDIDYHAFDTLFFDAMASKCLSSRNCTVGFDEARVTLKAWMAEKPIHGKKLGMYKVVRANKSQVAVGCHTFSGDYLRLVYDRLFSSAEKTAKELKYRDKGIQLLTAVNAAILVTDVQQ